MSLEARVAIAHRGVDVTIAVPGGGTLALLGPNGSGKSTLLAAIAGVLRPEAGRVALGGRVLHDLAHGRGAWSPPASRRVGLVTQGDDLFPAMSVLDNVAYGIRPRVPSRASARVEARAWLDRVGLPDLADRRPAQLSGGQARRVTLARALAAGPEALLLDEPFAGVDVDAASSLRTLVAEVTRGVTTVIATHEALDAHLLADEVAVLDAGAVVESGATTEVLRHPRTAFAARMAGRALVRGIVAEGGIMLPDGALVPADASELADGTPALVALGARDTALVDAAHAHLADTVVTLEPRGDLVRVVGRTVALEVTPDECGSLAPGTPLHVRLTHRPLAYQP